MTSQTDDEFLQGAELYASEYPQQLSARPAKHIAVVMCMDARLRAYGILGLKEGDAHIIRNAGGVVTDDVVRSLIISQRLLGTTAIALVHHTDCGMTKFTDDQLKAELQAETGQKPAFSLEAFSDPDEDVRQSMARIRSTPFIPHKDNVRGFVFEVETGKLRPVDS